VRNMRKNNVPQVIRMKISGHKTTAWSVAITSWMMPTCNSRKPVWCSQRRQVVYEVVNSQTQW